MTSNVGSQHFQRLQNPFGFRSGQAGAGQVQGDVRREMERRFSPEFRNRIDEVVVFEPLSIDQVRRIAEMHIDGIRVTLEHAGKSLVIGPGVLDALVTEGHNIAYGARFLKRVIDDRLKLPLSQQWKDGCGFVVSMKDGAIVVEPVGAAASVNPAALAG
jgi:ATP-dependent Clp protease ATP-binding subunit ClpA